ncbi:hypothetical protein HNP24_001751 [Chryseobacterium sediminis]|uniref:YopX protein domain-containing protein n=1 Tax=Chryseobacterium sediminis TaxID=1679494 RepID=A0ABR6PYM2_9FLAO|nr:DUF6334 family protein [Chryseobacterium sediminis]MBB6330801.1 hypothetical protein [Chryseobacterium sediminis]
MDKQLQWILGKTIQTVYIKRDENYNNNIISIYFIIENGILSLDVHQETDEIILGNLIDINNEQYREDLIISELFKNKKIISFWFPVNNQGFNDVFMLGLDKFVPTHLFSTIASCIKINIIKQIDNLS